MPDEASARARRAEETLVRIQEAVTLVEPGIWSIGGKLRLSLQRQPPAKQDSVVHIWQDGQGFWFVLSELQPSQGENLSQIVPRTLDPIYVAGEGRGCGHAVWDLGGAFLKVVNPVAPNKTREHVTLDYVRQKQPSFNIPETLYYGEWDGRYYQLLSRVPGETLLKSWTGMPEDTKAKCVARITQICKELASWQGDRIHGVDGGDLYEYYLDKNESWSFDHETLLQRSKELGMETSAFCFYHCDMAPSNILYDSTRGLLSVIDWEMAGFVPEKWIRTKFRISGGMDLECEGDAKYEYRKRVSKSLGEMGFEDVAMRWIEWRQE